MNINNDRLKSILINTKYWFDKTYGNTYYSSQITLNFGENDESKHCIPFTYGNPDNADYFVLHFICNKYNIPFCRQKLRESGVKIHIFEPVKATKRDVKAFGEMYADITLW